MTAVIGRPVGRVEGPAKVRGEARYAGEFRPANLAHAALVTSTVTRGRIMRLDDAQAAAAAGVLAVLSYRNAPRLPYKAMDQRPAVDPKAGEQLRVFQGPEVHFSGQPVAVVVAETAQQANHAASLVEITYDRLDDAAAFDSAAARAPTEESAKTGRPGVTSRGDADAAAARAPIRVEATYLQPREHHNAIEPHATIALWEGDRLTLYDKTQWVTSDRDEIAHVFGIEPQQVRVISPFVGGAFGSALRTWPHVAIAALAARHVGRPVRLVLTRRQLYSSIGYRPHTEQRVVLGAGHDGPAAGDHS